MVPAPWMEVRFAADAVVGEAPLEITFTDQSTWTPLTWFRDFGDWYFSSLQNPKHTYSKAWIYTVKLTISNRDKRLIAEKVDYIEITETDRWMDNVENISEARRGPRSFPPLQDKAIEQNAKALIVWRGERSLVTSEYDANPPQ